MGYDEQVMNTVQAAEYLEVSAGYMAGMRHYRTGPTFSQNKSGRVSYRKEDLDAWDEARRARHTSQRQRWQ